VHARTSVWLLMQRCTEWIRAVKPVEQKAFVDSWAKELSTFLASAAQTHPAQAAQGHVLRLLQIGGPSQRNAGASNAASGSAQELPSIFSIALPQLTAVLLKFPHILTLLPSSAGSAASVGAAASSVDAVSSAFLAQLVGCFRLPTASPAELTSFWTLCSMLLDKFCAEHSDVRGASSLPSLGNSASWRVSEMQVEWLLRDLLRQCRSAWHGVHHFTAVTALRLLYYLQTALEQLDHHLSTRPIIARLCAHKDMRELIELTIKAWRQMKDEQLDLQGLQLLAHTTAGAGVDAPALYQRFVRMVQSRSSHDLLSYLVIETVANDLPVQLLHTAIQSGGLASLRASLVSAGQSSAAGAAVDIVVSLGQLLRHHTAEYVEPALAILLDCSRHADSRVLLQPLVSDELVLRLQQQTINAAMSVESRLLSLRSVLVLQSLASAGEIHSGLVCQLDSLLHSGSNVALLLQCSFQDGVTLDSLLDTLHRCDRWICVHQEEARSMQLSYGEQTSLFGSVLKALVEAVQSKTSAQDGAQAIFLLSVVQQWSSASVAHRAVLQPYTPALVGLLCHPLPAIQACVSRIVPVLLQLTADEATQLAERFSLQDDNASLHPTGSSASSSAGAASAASASAAFHLGGTGGSAVEASREGAGDFSEVGDELLPLHVKQLQDRLAKVLLSRDDAVADLGAAVKGRAMAPQLEQHASAGAAALALVNTKTTQQNLARVMEAALINKPQLIEGASGVGKSATIEEAAKRFGAELLRINLSSRTTIDDLIGRVAFQPDLSGGGISLTFHEGLFTRAVRTGAWLLLDEMNLASDSVLAVLERAMDVGVLTYKDTSRAEDSVQHIPVAAGFRLFATQNPSSGHFKGTREPLSRSFLDRFMVVTFEELPDLEWVEIVEQRLRALTAAHPLPADSYHPLTILLVDVHLTIQKRTREKGWPFKEDAGYATITIRELLKCVHHMATYASDWQ